MAKGTRVGKMAVRMPKGMRRHRPSLNRHCCPARVQLTGIIQNSLGVMEAYREGQISDWEFEAARRNYDEAMKAIGKTSILKISEREWYTRRYEAVLEEYEKMRKIR